MTLGARLTTFRVSRSCVVSQGWVWLVSKTLTGANPTPDTLPVSLEDFRKTRIQPALTRREREKLGSLDRLAVWITQKVGTMGFFLLIFIWTFCWLAWNFLAPPSLRFDPPMGFVLWLFISNVIQILLMPLIMVGQNVQGTHAEARADYDLQVNVKAEEEIELVLSHLEYQNKMLIDLVKSITSQNSASSTPGEVIPGEGEQLG